MQFSFCFVSELKAISLICSSTLLSGTLRQVETDQKSPVKKKKKKKKVYKETV